MHPDWTRNYERLRDRFEGREAVYLEKGILIVRISDIHLDLDNPYVEATATEILTDGLRRSLSHENFFPDQEPPVTWGFGAGRLTSFSEHCWHMGYGGWRVTIDPKIVAAIREKAGSFPKEYDATQRYEGLVRIITDSWENERFVRVFSDREKGGVDGAAPSIPSRLSRDQYSFDPGLMDAMVCFVMVPTDLELLERAKLGFLEDWDERIEDYLGPAHDRDLHVRDDREMVKAVFAGKTDFSTVFWTSNSNTLMLGVDAEIEGQMVLSLSVDGFIAEAIHVLEALKRFTGTSLGYIWGGYYPPRDQAEHEARSKSHEDNIAGYLEEDLANRRIWEARQRDR